MTNTFISIPADQMSGAEFYRVVTGQPPRSAAEIAEADARAERIRVATLIHDAEYLIARRERDALIVRQCVEGVKLDLDAPFERAAERVRQRMARLGHRRAA